MKQTPREIQVASALKDHIQIACITKIVQNYLGPLDGCFSKVIQTYHGEVQKMICLDNDRIAVSWPGHGLQVHNVTTCKLERVLNNPDSFFRCPVLALAVFPNMNLIVASTAYYTFQMWDFMTGVAFDTFGYRSTLTHALAAMPSGALVSGGSDGVVRVWSPLHGTCSAVLEGHTDDIVALVALPNNVVASGSKDSKLRLWDLTLSTCYALLDLTFPMENMWLLPNNRLLYQIRDGGGFSVFDGSAHVWNFETARHERMIGKPLNHNKVFGLLPNGQMVSNNFNFVAKAWDLDNGECTDTLVIGANDWWWSQVVLMPDGRIVAAVREVDKEAWQEIQTTIKLWS